MRLFIGIGLPPSVSAALARAAHTLAAAAPQLRISWTPPENMHLTLSFLGQVDPARLDNIQQALAKLQSPRLHLQLDGPGLFPNAGILYAHVKPSAALLTFADHIFRAMEECGFPSEQRPYTPHITLARIKAPGKARLHLPSREQASPAFFQKFEADEFRLYESITNPKGPEYHVLRAFPLL
jgi:2'-5' RNA ligase